jgi:DNA polymerase
MSFCVVDVESFSACPIERGPVNYFADAQAGLFCVAYKINSEPVKVVWLTDEMRLPNELLQFQGRFVAHNWFFEYCAFKRFFPGTRLADVSSWLCTQAMSRRFGLAAPRSSLANVAALMKVEAQKNADGKRLIATYSVPYRQTGRFLPVTEKDKAAWMRYCADDVEAESAIFARLWPRFSDAEKAVFEADKRQQARGVPIDLKGVDALLRAEQIFIERAEKRAEEIAGRNDAGTLVLSGRDEFLLWLEKTHGVKLSDARADTLAQLYAETDNAELREALDIRTMLMTRAVDKAAKLKEMTAADGRCYNVSTYAAAHTGRWQSWGVNFFNFYKFAVESDKWEETLKTQLENPTKKGLASLQRGLVCAPRGYKLITTDWRGIENYLSLYYSGDAEQRKRVEAGESQYLIFGEKLFSRPISKKDAQEYNLAKIAVLSLGYGAGHVKFGAIAKMQAGIAINESMSRQIVKVWRSANKYVTSAWSAVEQAFRDAVNGASVETHSFCFSRRGKNTVCVTLPSGYELYYRGAGVDEQGSLFWTPDGVTREKIYGGLLWENLMQAVAAQLLRRALVQLEFDDVCVVLHVYDEIVVESKTREAESIAQRVSDVMRSAPDWAPDMKLEVEQKITQRWGK